jgi:class 3 adenylate cyclase/tetratricopeptide (TPR) repeat protein
MTYQDILARLLAPNAASDRLLDESRRPDLKLWEEHPNLYLAFCEKLIAQGHPSRALELAREGQQYLQDNSKLLYQMAQAANRGGNPRYAQTILKPLLAKALGETGPVPPDINTALRVDIVSLHASILKQRSVREEALAKESALWYERAAALPDARNLPDAGTFPLINAATMWRVAGDEAKSRQLADETVARLKGVAPERVDADVWMMATLGGAFVLLGRHAEAIEWYEKAGNLAMAQNAIGTIGVIRQNCRRLADVGATADAAFLDVHLGSTVVFSGHLLDSPERRAAGAPMRFPNDDHLLAAVDAAIRVKLDEMNVKVGFCSLGCGGDILFAEAILARGAELHVVLPFAQQDFRRTSVAFGQETAAWRRWARRFEDILAQLPDDCIHSATTEPFLGSDGLWSLCNSVTQGLTILRARERVSEPKALLLIDRSLPGKEGGTIGFGAAWVKAGLIAEEIDLKSLRETHWQPTTLPKERPAAPVPSSPLSRPIKTMLFADIAGFSAIPEWELPAFLDAYGAYLRKLFASSVGQHAAYANTWGDGLYVVFDNVVWAAEFAVELIEPRLMPPLDWAEFGLGETAPIRLGLHTGPVFELPDLFQGRPGYGGQHVNRAARIEPVAVRGCAYASETFAALLTVEAGDRFVIESVGIQSLAKEYDRCRLYRVERK